MLIRLSSSALALSLAAGPALALTPEEVWQGWHDQYTKMGYTVTEGSRDSAGETLTLKDVVLSVDAEGTKATITLPQVVLQGAGDGSVRSTFADVIPVKLELTEGESEPALVDLTLKSQGLEILTTGEGVARSDKLVSSAVTIAVDKVDPAGDAPDVLNPGSLTLNNVTTQTGTEDGVAYTTTGASEKVDFVVDIDQPDGSFKAGGNIADVTLDGTTSLPQGGTGEVMANLADSIRSGFKVNGTYTMGASTFDFSATSPESETSPASEASGTASSTGGDLTVAIGPEGVSYGGKTTGSKADITSSQLPAPISYALDEGRFDLLVPMLKSDTPAPFKLSYGLTNLTLADSVWALFDPSQKLKRDPANLDIDITGNANVSADLIDPEAMAAEEQAVDPTTAQAPDAAPAMPFMPTDLTINKLAIDAVGTKVDADGTFKVVDGNMSAPEGMMNIRLQGVDQLITALTDMGLIQADQVSGYRMMLAMIAKPGEGEDSLVSALEFKADGSVFANGQQIK